MSVQKEYEDVDFVACRLNVFAKTDDPYYKCHITTKDMLYDIDDVESIIVYNKDDIINEIRLETNKHTLPHTFFGVEIGSEKGYNLNMIYFNDEKKIDCIVSSDLDTHKKKILCGEKK